MNIDREKIKSNLLKDYRLAFMENTIFFLHRALWYNYATSANEMHSFHNNNLIRFLNF